MKNQSVLILCLNSSIGGVSTRMEGEVNAFINHGIDVYILGDLKVKDCSYATNSRVKEVKITDLSACNTVDKIIEALYHVESMILENNISFIYSHHPDMYLISAIAAQRLRLPFMITLHGIGFHLFNDPFQHFILRNFVYPYASLVTCMSPALTTISDIYAPDANLRLYHNLVNTERFNPKNADSVDNVDKGWLIVSRIGEEKLGGIVKLIEYAYRAGVESVSIAGDGGYHLLNKFKNLLSQAGITDFVKFLGPRKDIHKLMHEYSVIAGVDRVALEAGSSMKPVCILGYNGRIKGFLKPENFTKFAYTNFCGRDLPDLSLQDFVKEVQGISSINLQKIRDLILEDYSEVDKWQQNVGEYLTHIQFKENKNIQTMYDLMCFYNLPIEGQIYRSHIFKNKIVKDILKQKSEHKTYEEFLNLLEDSGTFIHPHNYAIEASKIQTSDSVVEGDTLFLRDESLLLNDGVLIDLESYLKAQYGHRMQVTIRAMTYAKNHDINPMLISVSFRNPNNGAALQEVAVDGLSFSENQDVGHFEYVQLKNYMSEFVYNINIKDGSEVSHIKLAKWRPKPGENMLIESIEVQVFN